MHISGLLQLLHSSKHNTNFWPHTFHNNIVKYKVSPEEINTINFISRYRNFFSSRNNNLLSPAFISWRLTPGTCLPLVSESLLSSPNIWETDNPITWLIKKLCHLLPVCSYYSPSSLDDLIWFPNIIRPRGKDNNSFIK